MTFKPYVSVGNGHIVFLKDGDIWGQGANWDGQLGSTNFNSTVNTLIQVTTTGDYVQVTAGEDQTWGLKEDGTVWGLGYDVGGGVTGVATGQRLQVPTLVTGLPTLKQIAGGPNACIGLTTTGDVWVWGIRQEVGLTGDYTSPYSPYKFKVSGLPTNVKELIFNADSNSPMVLMEDGDLWIWGENDDGQCGNGEFNNPSAPVPYLHCLPRKLASNVKTASGGYAATVVVKNDGTVWACGDNGTSIIAESNVGTPGNFGNFTTLTQIQGAPTNIKEICVNSFVGALTEDGNVWVWGEFYYYQDGTWDEYKPSQMYISQTGVDTLLGANGGTFLVQKEDEAHFSGSVGNLEEIWPPQVIATELPQEDTGPEGIPLPEQPPVINTQEVNKFTTNMMAMLPEWMKMAKDTESIGAKFLNAFGLEYEEIETYMNYMWDQKNIDLADLRTIDYVYKLSFPSQDVLRQDEENDVAIHLNGIRYTCTNASSLKVFYEATDMAYILDAQESIVYIRVPEEVMSQNIFSPFDYITINHAIFSEYSLHHIWNPFDEFGFLFGLRRNRGERNLAFKERILSVFSKKTDSTKDGLVNHLSKELAIPSEDISIGSLSDDQYVNTTLINADGTPTKKYLDYIKTINNTLPFTWDHMTWQDGYWQVLEDNLMGIHYIPHSWDVLSKWKKEQYQSGVGSGKDLKVHKPIKESSTREFKAYVGLKGIEEIEEELIPEIEFQYKIYAKGQIPIDLDKNESYKYTVVASEVIDLHYVLTAMKNFIYHTYVNWDGRYGFAFENNETPGMEIVTGETVLHNPTDPYIRIQTNFQTASPVSTPSLTSLTVEYVDQSDQLQQYTLNSSALFTQNNGMVTSSFTDTVVRGQQVELSNSPFEARIDTIGDFQKGENESSILILSAGAITLDLPKL